MKTFRTLCSGGELFGVGARAADWTHVDGYEIDPAIAVIARLNDFNVRVADVTRIDYARLPAVDHLHASPSCKTASQANTAGGETAGDLAVADAICRAIRAHTGRTFSLENVWGYRKYESFDRILTTLRACGFGVHVAHVNAADFGVPQTRKRLILRAVRGIERVPGLRPTHGKRGGILLARWNGWYAAIEDILHTLPPTKPAPWQLARMPKQIRETMLIGAGGYDGGIVARGADDPVFTITHGGETGSTGNTAQLRAYLVQSKNTNQEWGDGMRDGDEPAFSIVTDPKPSHAPKAYIVGGGNTQLAQIDSYARPADEPMFTVSAPDGARKTTAAYLLDGQTGSYGTNMTMRPGDAPAFTMRANSNDRQAVRAYAAGRWVRMTVQALGRFQTVPDEYRGLTSEINGNGVPCELARAIMASMSLC